jgi:hypothetical protein
MTGGRQRSCRRKVRTYYASDLLLVAEVISPRSGSEQVDRVRKVGEYARAGIPRLLGLRPYNGANPEQIEDSSGRLCWMSGLRLRPYHANRQKP